MRKLVLLMASLGFSVFASAQKLTVASYNIRNCIGLDNVKDIDRTAGVINTLDADLLAVQEIDSVTNRSKKLDIIKELAERTNMYYTYASAISYDGGAYGMGLLSKEKPLRTYKIALPGREEKRALLVCEFKKYVMFATHFSYTPEDALASSKIVNNEAEKFDKPVFFAGDLNITPDSDTYASLLDGFTPLSDITKGTYPADKPKDYCIDYIMGNKKFTYKVTSASVCEAPVESDHRPIRVKIKSIK